MEQYEFLGKLHTEYLNGNFESKIDFYKSLKGRKFEGGWVIYFNDLRQDYMYTCGNGISSFASTIFSIKPR